REGVEREGIKGSKRDVERFFVRLLLPCTFKNEGGERFKNRIEPCHDERAFCPYRVLEAVREIFGSHTWYGVASFSRKIKRLYRGVRSRCSLGAPTCELFESKKGILAPFDGSQVLDEASERISA